MVLVYALAVVMLGLCAFNRLMPARAARLGLRLERRRAGLSAKRSSLPYLAGGNGSEVLVLLHGFGADKDNFTRIAAWLVPHYRVIIPDLPGFGSARRDALAKHDIAQQVENLRAFLGELDVQRFHLGGNSMGGFIACEYAARYPAQVASLWLLDAAGTDVAWQTRAFQHYRKTGRSSLLVPEPQALKDLIGFCMHRPPWLPYCLIHQLAQRAVEDYPLHVQIMREVVDSPVLAERIDTPALIVWGKEDRVLNPQAAEPMQALLPNSEVVLMEGIGHVPMVEAPRRTASDFLAFQRRLSERQAEVAA
ncbi:alpha/beta fold hydrolase [Pseudoduganella sp. UC29_106]|uniref:alpha/beta fold hydrolase n=1 Tax=Pseudoduganella sp. UC29_106 TaxID=3374553 RepID=UPI0037568B5E